MRKAFFPLLAAAVFLAPGAASAGFLLQASVGQGGRVHPDADALPLNVMVTPGYGLLDDLLQFQLGLVAEIPTLKESKFDISLRPMLTVDLPVIPVHIRAIFAFAQLIEDFTISYGGAVGVNFEIGPLGLFIEAGVLPAHKEDAIHWILEGRLGASLSF